MKQKYENINEELIRMKSLFGEERLYGNCCQSTIKKLPLLIEGRVDAAMDLGLTIYKSFVKALDDLPSGEKYIEIPPQRAGDPTIRVEVDPDGGGIILKRGDKLMDPKKLSSYLSDRVIKEIDEITANVSIDQDWDKFFNGTSQAQKLAGDKDIYDIYKLMIDDLTFRGADDKGGIFTADEAVALMNRYKMNKVGPSVKKNIDAADFWDDIYSIEDIRKYHPETARLIFDDIPALGDLLVKRGEVKSPLGRLLNIETGRVVKLLDDALTNDKIINIGSTDAGLTTFETQKGLKVILDSRNNTIKIPSEWVSEIDEVVSHPKEWLNKYGIDPDDVSGAYSGKIGEIDHITIKLSDANADDMKFVEDLMQLGPKVRTSPKVKEVGVIDLTSDLNIKKGKLKHLGQNLKDNTSVKTSGNWWKRKLFSASAVKKAFTSLLHDNKFSEEMKNTFLKDFNSRYNVKKWMKRKWVQQGTQSGENVLAQDQENFLKGLYKSSVEGEEVFIRKTDKTLLDKYPHLKEGDINPNIVLKEGKAETFQLYEDVGLGPWTWFNNFVGKGDVGNNYNTWQKVIGRLGGRAGLVFGYPCTHDTDAQGNKTTFRYQVIPNLVGMEWPCGWPPFTILLAPFANAAFALFAESWTNKMLQANLDIEAAAKIFQQNCITKISSTLYKLFPDMQEFSNRIIKEIGVIAGDAPDAKGGSLGKLGQVGYKDAVTGLSPEWIGFGRDVKRDEDNKPIDFYGDKEGVQTEKDFWPSTGFFEKDTRVMKEKDLKYATEIYLPAGAGSSWIEIIGDKKEDKKARVWFNKMEHKSGGATIYKPAEIGEDGADSVDIPLHVCGNFSDFYNKWKEKITNLDMLDIFYENWWDLMVTRNLDFKDIITAFVNDQLELVNNKFKENIWDPKKDKVRDILPNIQKGVKRTQSKLDGLVNNTEVRKVPVEDGIKPKNDPSDIRLKENIIKVGMSKKMKIPIYEFNYISDKKRIYRGTMAQDLLNTSYKSAVILNNNGYYSIKYDEIDVDFVQINN